MPCRAEIKAVACWSFCISGNSPTVLESASDQGIPGGPVACFGLVGIFLKGNGHWRTSWFGSNLKMCQQDPTSSWSPVNSCKSCLWRQWSQWAFRQGVGSCEHLQAALDAACKLMVGLTLLIQRSKRVGKENRRNWASCRKSWRWYAGCRCSNHRSEPTLALHGINSYTCLHCKILGTLTN